MVYLISNDPTQDVHDLKFNTWKSLNQHALRGLSDVANFDDKLDDTLKTVFTSAVNIDRKPELNFADFTAGSALFNAHYATGPAIPGTLNNQLVVSWNTFKAKVTELNTDPATTKPIIPYNNLALKFIHRYNTTSAQWYLSVQLYSITPDPVYTPTSVSYNLYDLTNSTIYFDINPNGTLTPNPGDLDGTDGLRYSETYFNNVLCDNTAIVYGNHVQSVYYAWNEFQQIFDSNQTTTRLDSNLFSLIFSSSSFNNHKYNPIVHFPHSVVINLRYDGTDCLDNGGYIIGNFFNRAGDYNTLCPTRCNNIEIPGGYFAFPHP